MSRARSARRPKLGERIATARVRYARTGPRKVRMVADVIRGLSVAKAQEQLALMHKPSSEPLVTKALRSAFHNANNQVDGIRYEPEGLIVGKIFVDSGPIAYRFQPMSMGRAGKIRKRCCHLTIELFEAV